MERKILIVDDEPDILEIYGIEFRNRGFQVQIAQDGDEALSCASEFGPDILISDISMPKVNGIDLISHFREKEEFQNMPIIMVSGHSDEGKKVELERAGADAYFEKPINFDHLIAKIDNLLKKAMVFSKDADVLFSGKIEQMPLLEVMQFFNQSRKTGILAITNTDKPPGKIIFDEGDIRFACYPPFFGIAAIQHLIRIESGEFRLVPNDSLFLKNIWISSSNLIMRGATELDEFNIDEIESQIFVNVDNKFWINGRKYLTDLSKKMPGIVNISVFEKTGRVLLSLDNSMDIAIEVATNYLNFARLSLEDNFSSNENICYMATGKRYLLFLKLKVNFVLAIELDKDTQIGVVIKKIQKGIEEINNFF